MSELMIVDIFVKPLQFGYCKIANMYHLTDCFVFEINSHILIQVQLLSIFHVIFVVTYRIISDIVKVGDMFLKKVIIPK